MGSRKAEGSQAIPDKHSFRIGEVAKIAGVRPSVLRYWETEFPSLRPEKSRSGQRVYARRHVELVLEVKRLLKEQRFTIDGARKALRGGKQAKIADAALVSRIRKEVEELLQLVEE
jgi:DNA-binding transcriptional MerR regulator